MNQTMPTLRGVFAQALPIAVTDARERQLHLVYPVLGTPEYWTRILLDAQAIAAARTAVRSQVSPEMAQSLSTIAIEILSYLGSGTMMESAWDQIGSRIDSMTAARKSRALDAGSEPVSEEQIDLDDVRQRLAVVEEDPGNNAQNIIQAFEAWLGVIQVLLVSALLPSSNEKN